MMRRTLFVVVSLLLIVTLLAPAGQAGANAAMSAEPAYYVRLRGVTLDDLQSLGVVPALAVDYGSFLWLGVDEAGYLLLRQAGLAFDAQTATEAFTLRLGEQSFDPLRGGPNLPNRLANLPGPGPDLRLVQLDGPARAEWLQSLGKAGLQIVQYIYPHTYVVWGDEAAVNQLAVHSFVRWTGEFAPAYRLLPRWQNLPDAALAINVMLYRGADVDAAIGQIEALGGSLQDRAVIDSTFEIAGFTLSGVQLPAAARISGVYSVQPVPTDGGLRGEMSDQINVGNYDGTNLAFPGYLDWLAAAGVDGSGVIMANVDGGVYNQHPDLVARFVPCTGTTCGGSASSDHGTHTAGIMAADGASGVVDSYGFLRGLGMAPGANLVEQVNSPWAYNPGGMLLLITESQRNGALLSSNSWGPSGSPQGYDDDTRQVDVGVRDADPDAVGNQPFNFILSIMNGNGGVSTQGTPDEAKNIFTIGSTKAQTGGGAQILQIDDLSSNSAHGPALDGRKIPHMVAPGCDVDSTVPGGYDLMCGTSMSSPHASGAVALFIEYYRNHFGVDPSPALVKAAYLPVAHDLYGHQDADGNTLGHPFDSKQGWGRMNAAAVVSPTVEVLYFDSPVIFDGTGEEWVQRLGVRDPSQPMRLMLVWTDAPGHGLGGSTPAWNNDLDLVVEYDGQTYYGNQLNTATGWSQPGGSADYMNNTEGVFLGPVANGAVLVRVVASDINSDAIPNQGDNTDQDFALVCYNCSLGADFTLEAAPDIRGICALQPATYDLTLEALLDFTQTVNLSVQGAPALSNVAVVPAALVPPGTSTLTVTSPVSATWGLYSLDIIGTAITRVHTATVGLELFTIIPTAPQPLIPAAEATEVELLPVFAWISPTQAATYQIEIATDVQFTNLVEVAAGLVQPEYIPATALTPNTVYYWRVKAVNICGEGEYSPTRRFLTAPALGQCAQGTVALTLLSEDFETGASGWAHGGIGDTWAPSTVRKHGGVTSFQATNVAQASDQWLQTPLFTLPEEQRLFMLDFWHYRRLQPGGCYDGGVLEISNDGGTTWTPLEDELLAGLYDGVLESGMQNPLEGYSAWCETQTAFVHSMASLEAYAGQDVALRFRLGSNNFGSAEGWYVDDVTVHSCIAAVQLGPDSTVQTLAGEVVTHTFTITNQGAADSFALLVSDFTWPTMIVGGEVIMVSPGATTTVAVRVEVPAGVANVSDGFTLTASSASIPGVVVTVDGVTEVSGIRLFLPMMVR